MKIIPLINEITNTFNKKFKENLNPLNLESKIKDVGDTFTLRLYESFLNYLDENFKKNKQRKEEYYIKQTRQRTLITSIGEITVNSTSYVNKITKKYYVPLRDFLNLEPYQRLTNEAEYQLIKYAMEENMSQSAKHALRNIIIHRSTVSRKISKLDGNIVENIEKCKNQPDVLYIEMDEIHANLQHEGNKICPAAIVHEGYEEDFVKRKKLKNIRYFADSELTYEELWEVIFDYVDKRYDINKFKTIFVSGDGASGIKNYKNCFPNAKFVLDPFHYIKKHLKYIFKDEKELMKIADEYVRNDMIKEFKILVNYEIKKYPEQKKYITMHMEYIINNLEGIKNQHNPLYKCHCSMEGHINQAFARYITSSPYAFSKKGLRNKLKLLVMHANKHELTIEDYYNLKYGNNTYDEININVKKICNIKYDQKLSSNHSSEYKINTKIPVFDSYSDNNKLKELITPRREIYII
jgi:hypothetical protein